MPPAEDIQRSLSGAWRLMMGKPDGLRLLDITADGFWNSFFAIVVALPPFAIGWIALADDLAAMPDIAGGRASLVLRLALVDLGAWLVPLAALGFAASTIGIRDRYVHYVVATNWASAIVVWLMLPPSLLRLFAPATQDLASGVSLGLFVITLFLSWRVTNAAIGKGPAYATGIFVGMIVASLAVLFLLQDLLGLAPVAQVPG